MAFDPTALPARVYEAYKLGPATWPYLVEKAKLAGITNPDKIADIVFFLHHPERGGRALEASDTALIKQWKGFRYLIKLQLAPKLVSPPPSSGGGEGRRGNVEFEWQVEAGEE